MVRAAGSSAVERRRPVAAVANESIHNPSPLLPSSPRTAASTSPPPPPPPPPPQTHTHARTRPSYHGRALRRRRARHHIRARGRRARRRSVGPGRAPRLPPPELTGRRPRPAALPAPGPPPARRARRRRRRDGRGEQGRHRRAAGEVGQHDPVPGHRRRREGQLRAPGPPHGLRARGPRPLRRGHALQPQEPLLVQPRPLRPLCRPRLHAPVRPAPLSRLRQRQGEAAGSLLARTLFSVCICALRVQNWSGELGSR